MTWYRRLLRVNGNRPSDYRTNGQPTTVASIRLLVSTLCQASKRRAALITGSWRSVVILMNVESRSYRRRCSLW